MTTDMDGSKERFTSRAEEVHARWCRANTDHPTEIAMMAQALREAYDTGKRDAVSIINSAPKGPR